MGSAGSVSGKSRWKAWADAGNVDVNVGNTPTVVTSARKRSGHVGGRHMMLDGKSAARAYAKIVLSKPAHWVQANWQRAAILMASDVISYVEGPKPMTGKDCCMGYRENHDIGCTGTKSIGEPGAGAGISKERKAHGE